jgi:hypothetical protein
MRDDQTEKYKVVAPACFWLVENKRKVFDRCILLSNRWEFTNVRQLFRPRFDPFVNKLLMTNYSNKCIYEKKKLLMK